MSPFTIIYGLNKDCEQKFETQVLKSPLNQKLKYGFSFLICYFYDNIDQICEFLFSKLKLNFNFKNIS